MFETETKNDKSLQKMYFAGKAIRTSNYWRRLFERQKSYEDSETTAIAQHQRQK